MDMKQVTPISSSLIYMDMKIYITMSMSIYHNIMITVKSIEKL